MRRCRVKRLRARDWGVGRWRHRYTKYADSLSTWERKGAVFKFFQPETRFQKSVFRSTAFTGAMWRTGQNDAKHVRLHTTAFPCGWPLWYHLPKPLIILWSAGFTYSGWWIQAETRPVWGQGRHSQHVFSCLVLSDRLQLSWDTWSQNCWLLKKIQIIPLAKLRNVSFQFSLVFCSHL